MLKNKMLGVALVPLFLSHPMPDLSTFKITPESNHFLSSPCCLYEAKVFSLFFFPPVPSQLLPWASTLALTEGYFLSPATQMRTYLIKSRLLQICAVARLRVKPKDPKWPPVL